jgi:seryl-tRNA synthetase
MLDIKLFREKPDLIKENQINKGFDDMDVDKVVRLDEEWRKIKGEIDNLRAKRNKFSKEISELKKAGKNADELMKEAKKIPGEIAEKEINMDKKRNERDSIIKEIPNLLDKDVPIGDASKNKVLKEYGKIKKITFEYKDHADVLLNLDLVDTDKASKVSGSRFYYLKGDLVKLNYSIISLALDILREKGFTLMQPPYMLRRDALEGAVNLGTFEEMIYKIEGEDLYLIGTAEHALNAFHMDESLNPKDLPLRYAGVSPCFRKEAGSHGKDTKGIFRVHQFDKVEQFVFCKPEDSENEFKLILENTIELFKKLEIPFRTVLLSSKDMGRVPSKTIDLEGYFPSQKAYRELASCSNCTDYQARRSNIKYQKGNDLDYVHTLNNTAVATERMLACIIDNFQQKDGSIKIPEALWKYTGFKEIKTKREDNKCKTEKNI